MDIRWGPRRFRSSYNSEGSLPNPYRRALQESEKAEPVWPAKNITRVRSLVETGTVRYFRSNGTSCVDVGAIKVVAVV